MMRLRFYIVMFIAAAAPLMAQGPHEVLLLVNADNPESVEIGQAWATMRSVPRQNIVRLKLPSKYKSQQHDISVEDFNDFIWKPAQKAVEERGLKHVLAWVYSSGFPVRVTGEPAVSITGLTFLRNRYPSLKEVKNAVYASPMFAGRLKPADKAHNPQSLDLYKGWLGKEMPLPCMMLGYTGKRGNTKEEVLACLRRGVDSDFGKPDGRVYFIDTKDVRSEVRRWQFPVAMAELKKVKVSSVITNSFPQNQKDVLGVMTGAAELRGLSDNSYKPGAMCEHLTSLAAAFDNKGQTKATEWIRAGATASAGTVDEPYAIWPKFPDARFYFYYASGCTMMESFYQSVRSPLQLLIIGEPLARPWAKRADIVLKGAEKGGAPAPSMELSVEVNTDSMDYYRTVTWLVDGRIVANGRRWTLSAKDYKVGRHELRVVAAKTGLVKSQVFKEFVFTVKEDGIVF
ncbi:hypothetical protein BVX97_05695 [bacterium E08(2017)]|nr:hypothetical protein BVX97_05695 [bacterium E08(2017)]